jgi:hypothetical protein
VDGHLRITSNDDTPITMRSLRKINPDRLAATAELADTPAQAETARSLREAFEEAVRDADADELVADFVADLESRGLAAEATELRGDAAERGASAVVADSVAEWESFRTTREMWIASAERVAPDVMARVREQVRGGRRGRAPREFYRDVAEWARHARTKGLPVYAHIAEQAPLWGRVDPSRDTIRRWLRRAETEEFLRPGEIRAPRKKENQ